jgi:hypothetical protein
VYDTLISGRSLKGTTSFLNLFIGFLHYILLVLSQRSLIKLDIGYNFQFGFQNPASTVMESLINLHHDIMFFLILIVVKIIVLILIIINLNEN